jgi:hypothetical protein
MMGGGMMIPMGGGMMPGMGPGGGREMIIVR